MLILSGPGFQRVGMGISKTSFQLYRRWVAPSYTVSQSRNFMSRFHLFFIWSSHYFVLMLLTSYCQLHLPSLLFCFRLAISFQIFSPPLTSISVRSRTPDDFHCLRRYPASLLRSQEISSTWSAAIFPLHFVRGTGTREFHWIKI